MAARKQCISERMLYEILVGPTSGGNAERLAAWAFGRGPEYDNREQYVEGKYQKWEAGTEVKNIVPSDEPYGFARIEGRD